MVKSLIIGILLTASLAFNVAGGVQSTGFSRGVSGAASLQAAQNVSSQSGSPSRPDAPEIAIPVVWPVDAQFNHLSRIGQGIGIVYSPDFSMRGNRQFYEKLGFAYFEDPGWQNVLSQIAEHNSSTQGPKIQTLIIETHGTNGEGLKLQAGPAKTAARSYISIAAMKEKLEGTGIHLVILAACNAGRLFRPEIYETLNSESTDPLFLPPNLGIINASPGFDPATSDVIVVRRVESHLETTNEGATTELSPIAQTLMGLRARAARRGARPVVHSLSFAVSDMLIELLTHDARLHLVATGYDTVKSRGDYSDDDSEDMYNNFLKYLDAVAAREYQATHPLQAAVRGRATPGSRPAPARASRAIRATGR